jgi:transposase
MYGDCRQNQQGNLQQSPNILFHYLLPIVFSYYRASTTRRSQLGLGAPTRRILNGLIFRARPGCQWNHIPEVYGDASIVDRAFQHWVELNIFELLWSLLLAECDGLELGPGGGKPTIALRAMCVRAGIKCARITPRKSHGACA